MLHLLKRFSLLSVLFVSVLLGACSLFAPPPPAPVKPTVVPDNDMIGAIRAAGDREKSVISVNPLRDPGVTLLQDTAQSDEQAGRYADAASKLDQAIKLSPDSPDLLQDRAEIAVRLKDYATAEKLAHQSWSIGPKLGPLCARNWQTIVEMRLQAGDKPGADTARKWVQQCHKAGIERY
jgi:tetratricopeptide (TPR) repeat protein